MLIVDASKEYDRSVKKFRRNRLKYPARLLIQKKNFHAYCVGTPKSGTHSITEMLNKFRSRHEPDEIFMILLIKKVIENEINDTSILRLLSARNICNWLEMDASHYNGVIIKQLVALQQDAKFVLTIRDCLGWMDSWFNHQLSRPALDRMSIYSVGRGNYYDKGHEYTKYDYFMKDLGLFPIRSYLEFWNKHNSRVLSSVPEKKLLILKTTEISQSSQELARFLEIRNEEISSKNSHSFKAKRKFNLLERIDSNYLYETAVDTCGELNDKFFPERTIRLAVNNLGTEIGSDGNRN